MLGLAEEDALEEDALGFGEGTRAEQARGRKQLGLRRKGWIATQGKEEGARSYHVEKRRK